MVKFSLPEQGRTSRSGHKGGIGLTNKAILSLQKHPAQSNASETDS